MTEVPKTAREQVVEATARALCWDRNHNHRGARGFCRGCKRMAHLALDAALSEPLTQVCATCGNTGLTTHPQAKVAGERVPIGCPECMGNGTTTSGPAIIQALVEEGAMEQVGMAVETQGHWGTPHPLQEACNVNGCEPLYRALSPKERTQC